MPLKINKYKIQSKNDRRIKLTPNDREAIKNKSFLFLNKINKI